MTMMTVMYSGGGGGGFYPLSRGNYFKIVREFVKLMANVKWCDFIKMC